MRAARLRDWKGGRVFVIVDEYAEIHDSINDAKRGESKDAASRLANNLKRIIRRARSLGVVMVCALQKPTTDAMDSTLRANMNFRVCFRVKTRQSVEAVLDAYEGLPQDPLRLKDGQFVLDVGRGKYEYLQTQIAPGVTLGDEL
jgi:DNA segregation ATPase FtsK/SpoIIIE-like protein